MRYAKPYKRQEDLIASARRRPEIWRLVAGFVMCCALYLIGLLLFRRLLAGLFSVPVGSVDSGLLAPASPLWSLALLFSFATLGLSVVIAARIVHGRSLPELIGPFAPALITFLRVVAWVMALRLALEILPPYGADDKLPNEQMPFALWLMLLPASVLGVILQTGSEELLFRGYLQSQIAAQSRNPLLWMGIPSALFAVLHYSPAMLGDAALMIAVWAFGFGVLAADLTARSGSLGPAIGFHFANNALAMLYVGLPGGTGGLALYHLPFRADELQPTSPVLLVNFVVLVLSWLAARIAIRR